MINTPLLHVVLPIFWFNKEDTAILNSGTLLTRKETLTVKDKWYNLKMHLLLEAK